MEKFNYTIKDEIGIHARPAGLLVKTASRFRSDISIKNCANDKSADAKKLFAVMGLGIKGQSTVEISAEGADEKEAAAALADFFEKNL